MKRLVIACALVLPLAGLAAPASAEVKTREKSQVKFEGMLGRMVGLFGGRAAREGIVSTTAVKGNRKVTMSETTGRIVDLSEEKIYDLDLRRKTYTVTTFDDLRRQMREAREKAEREAQKEAERDRGREEPAREPGKEVEIDFDMKETGQTRTIAGHNAREIVMTVTVREKGRTLEDGGGLVMTSNTWLGPDIPQMNEAAEFERRYWQQLQGPEAAAISAEQMAAVLALYPMVQQAMERMQKENVRLEGSPLATTMLFEAVRSREQMAQDAQADTGGGGGGIGGMLARRIAKRDPPQQRGTILTVTHEVQEISTTVPPADLEIPAGFKQRT